VCQWPTQLLLACWLLARWHPHSLPADTACCCFSCLAVQQLSSVSVASSAASLCTAGQQSYTTPQGPCYWCKAGSVNAAAGGICQPCSIANAVSNEARTSCMCAAGFEPVTSPATGALLKCAARSLNQCRAVADAEVDIVGTGCARAAGYSPTYSSSGTLTSCTPPTPPVLPVNATAVSGTWTVIPVLANDAGAARRIEAVSEPLAGGKAVIAANIAGADTIKYLSRAGFTGTDSFNYTTAAGTASVTVNVTAGSCAGSKCGVLGSCQAGKCSCAPDSGMLPMFVSNPDAAARAATPKVPACRYPGELPVGIIHCVGLASAALFGHLWQFPNICLW
jgi:hypothetical protein